MSVPSFRRSATGSMKTLISPCESVYWLQTSRRFTSRFLAQSAILERDEIRIGLAENGGDPEQDGCAFRVDGVEDLLMEFKSSGLEKELSDIRVENRKDGSTFRVFFVVAPDGLCYWFGERQ